MILLCYKNFGAYVGISHIGLGVSAMNTSKMLNAAGYKTDILPLKEASDLREFLKTTKKTYTHVVVSAPWIPTSMWAQICAMYPEIRFAMNCHSNVGFLQADSNGIQLIREGLDLETGTHNFHVAANSERMCHFVHDAYGDECTYLPNLYYIGQHDGLPRPPWNHSGGVLKIGIFGATRSLKNILSAVGACIIISRKLKAQTEIWISTGREDSRDVGVILRAVENLTANLPSLNVMKASWSSWPKFRKIVGAMHLLMQPSYTESFNMVTADGVSQGVPSVVSNAITWAPSEWRADVDDVESIARVGIGILHDPSAGHRGLSALTRHNKLSLQAWRDFIEG